MEQPGFNDNPSAPTADALQLVMLQNSSDEEKEGVYEFMKYFTTPENQAKWSMGTGYVAVRESTQEVEEFKSYAEENPQHWFRFSRHLTEHRLFRIRQEERFWMPVNCSG